MSLAALARQMHDAGTPIEGIILALEALEARDNAAAAKRAQAAARKQAQRDRERDSHATVTGLSEDIPAPLSSPLSFPPDPLTNPPYNPPTPAISVRAKAVQFVEPKGVKADSWQAFRKQRKKALTQIAYDRILKTLEDGKAAGWPPGELVDLAIERGWETVFVPKEQRNGTHQPNHAASAGRPQRASPALALLREAELQERAERDQAFGGGTGFALQALGSG